MVKYSNFEYILFKRFSVKAILWYVVAYLFFILFYNDYIPSISHLLIQGVCVLIYSFLCIYSLRKSIGPQQFFQTLFYCILSQIVLLRIWNIIVYDNPLGYNPIDSIGYDEFARVFSENKFDIWDLFSYLKNSGESIDDYGFNSIISITYKIFSPEIGIWILAIFNAIAWIIGCYYLYKLSGIFHLGQESSRIISLLWGTFSYCIFTAATGLKENFFCCVVIFTMFRLYKYFVRNNLTNLFLFMLGVIGCSLFRLALLFIYLATFLFVIALKISFFKKHLKFWIIVGISLSFLLLTVVINYISNLRGSMAVNQGYLDAITSGSNLIIYMGTNILSVFTGPIPNIISDIEKLNYITLWNFGTFLRFLLSGYSLYAICLIVKQNNQKFYPLIFFIVLHSVMLIVTMFAIHDRYQMVQLPFIYILSIFGLKQIKMSKKSIRMFFDNIYIIGATAFIILFNILKF